MRLYLTAKAFRSSLLGVLAFGALACGQLEGDAQRAPVLATIRGQLSNPESYSAGSNLRIAILWGGQDSRDVRVSQDIAAEAVFPSQFKLDLRELPPMSAMRAIGDDDSKKAQPGASCTPGYNPQSGNPPPAPDATCDSDAPPMAGPTPTPAPPLPPKGGSSGGSRIQSNDDWRPVRPGDTFRLALGALVAYEDLNGNGKLDLLDDKATQAVDRIVGINEDVYVVYTEGEAPPDVARFGVPKGFSLIEVTRCTVSDASDFAEPTTPQGPDTAGSPGSTGGGDARDGTSTPGGPTTGNVPEDNVTVHCDASKEASVKPIDTLITLPLTASPALSSFMCQGTGQFTSGTVMTSSAPKVSKTELPPAPDVPVVYPKADDPSLHCKADGSSLTYSPCGPQTLCGDQLCSQVTVTRPTSTPADWPCSAP